MAENCCRFQRISGNCVTGPFGTSCDRLRHLFNMSQMLQSIINKNEFSVTFLFQPWIKIIFFQLTSQLLYSIQYRKFPFSFTPKNLVPGAVLLLLQ
jgi:hypothetical protein